MMLSGSFLPPPTFPLYLRFIGHTRDSISLILTTPIQQLGYTSIYYFVLYAGQIMCHFNNNGYGDGLYTSKSWKSPRHKLVFPQ